MTLCQIEDVINVYKPFDPFETKRGRLIQRGECNTFDVVRCSVIGTTTHMSTLNLHGNLGQILEGPLACETPSWCLSHEAHERTSNVGDGASNVYSIKTL